MESEGGEKLVDNPHAGDEVALIVVLEDVPKDVERGWVLLGSDNEVSDFLVCSCVLLRRVLVCVFSGGLVKLVSDNEVSGRLPFEVSCSVVCSWVFFGCPGSDLSGAGGAGSETCGGGGGSGLVGGGGGGGTGTGSTGGGDSGGSGFIGGGPGLGPTGGGGPFLPPNQPQLPPQNGQTQILQKGQMQNLPPRPWTRTQYMPPGPITRGTQRTAPPELEAAAGTSTVVVPVKLAKPEIVCLCKTML